MKKKIMLSVVLGTCIIAISLQKVIAQNTSPYWSLAGNSNATTSSKLGTTNSVPLRFFTGNAERMRIQTDGKVGIGTTAPINIFTVKATTGTPASSWVTAGVPVFVGFAEAASSEFYLSSASNTSDFRPVFSGKRARGTLAAPARVANNDYITSITAAAYDGSSFLSPVAINVYVDGTPTTSHVPARISFETGTSRSDRLERLKIGSTGNFYFNDDQLFLDNSTGRIGIGTTALAAKLDINNTDNFYGINVINAFTGFEDREGIASYSVTNPGYGIGLLSTGGYYGIEGIGSGGNYTGPAYGVYGEADGTAGTRYGVSGVASGGTTDYGVYGYAQGGTSFNAAGYFNGDVYANGVLVTSDRKFKTDIAPLKNSLQQLMSLKPSSYLFKKAENPAMALPAGRQMGLVADEVKKVFPELVQEAVHPALYGKKRTEVISPEVKYEAVNYIGLIPVLVASVQEQQKSIELQQDLIKEQQKQIEELKEIVKKVAGQKDIKTNLSNAVLEQNNPNPLDKFTNIRYSIPAGSKNAQLIINDISGKTIKQIPLRSSPTGNVNFNAAGLTTGTYTYSIIVDGKLTETKKMIVAKSNNF